MTPTNLSELTFYRGRVGLYAILQALGVSKGDQVATQAFTCLAVPEGIMATGATPLWIDIEPNGVNIDPADLAQKLSNQTKAIVIQHTFGIPAQISPILQLAQERQIPVIEDCCHTFASLYNGKPVGTHGVGAFYSFEWGKPLVAGIGGSATLNDPNLHQKVKLFHDQIQDPPPKSQLKINLQYAGYSLLYSPKRFWKVREIFQKLSASGAAEGNYNPTGEVAPDFNWDMAPACRQRLALQLAKADNITAHANTIAQIYTDNLKNPSLSPAFVPAESTPVYARYPLLASDKQTILAKAREANIEVAEWYSTAVHPLTAADWAPIHLQAGQCPQAELRSTQIVSLPINSKTTSQIAHQTVDFLNSLA